jgi:hypothetical protein
MKNIYALLIIAVLAIGCSKSNDEPAPDPDAVPTENPSTPIPEQSILVLNSGNLRTITIRGRVEQIFFDRLFKKADGTFPGEIDPTRTVWRIEYDKVTLASLGKQEFTFTRTAPYTYVITHTVNSQYYETNRITLQNYYPTRTRVEKEY